MGCGEKGKDKKIILIKIYKKMVKRHAYHDINTTVRKKKNSLGQIEERQRVIIDLYFPINSSYLFIQDTFY